MLDSDGLLTISGSGKMKDYKDSSTPWYSNKDSIKSVVIEDGVTSIGNYAFKRTSLTSISIPNSVSYIGEAAFWQCTSLTSVTIPDSVSLIGSVAFQSCSALTSITIPDSVSYIGFDTFAYCNSLTNIIIPDSVSSINNGNFAGCRKLTHITIPNSVTSINPAAFWQCTSLKNITIPNSVSYIGYNTFLDCSSLENITIPDSVTSIGQNAFASCYKLKEATILSKTATFGSDVFKNSDEDFVIKGYGGSTAQTYAEENNHTFIDIETGAVSTPAPSSTTNPNSGSSAANTTITALPASGVIIGTGSMTELTGAQIISVEVPADGEMMDFTLDPNKILSRVLSNDKIKVDSAASLLFNNRDTDGNLIGMSGKSDPIRFTNKGRMPVNASLEISPESTFNETDSGLNLVEKISDFNGEKANVYLAAGLAECENHSIGAAGGAVINAMVPDSRENFMLERTDELEFEYIENEDAENWNALEIYLTGDLDILYPHWNDTSIIPPSRFSNAKYTTVWTLKTIPVSADVLNTKVKSVTLPLKGTKTSTKKIYIKPLNCSLSNQSSVPPEAELLDVSEVNDMLKINNDEIILKTPFAEYCKSKWGQGSVVVYAPDSQGAIVKIV